MARLVINPQDWPFRIGEHASLYWLRSPYQVGEGKNWMMTAVFKGGDGALRDIRVPWGMLPALRLGDIYCDGIWTEKTVPMENRNIAFETASKPEVVDAILLPRDLCKLGTKWNLQEKCYSFWHDRQRIVVPCLVIIRAYFALNRLLTEQLMQPDSFNGLCTSVVKDGGGVHLIFSDKVPVKILSIEAVKRVALIFQENSYYNAWRRVWASATCGGAGYDDSLRKSFKPLICEPPVVKRSSWTVSGLSNGKTFLVHDIKCFNLGLKPPFSSISYEHPSFRQLEDDFTRYGGSRTEESPEEVVVGSAPSSPHSTTNPHMVEVGTSSASFPFPIRVEKVTQQTMKSPGEGDFRNAGDVRHKKVSRVEGSLNEMSGTGELPAVEFLPFESLNDVQPAFHKLFKALSHKPGANSFFYQIATAPDESRIPKLNGCNRAIAQVCISVFGKLVYLMEVDNSDEHAQSTLLFVPPDEQAVSKCIATVLCKGVASGGHWDMDELQSILCAGRHYLAKHTRCSYKSWGERLNTAARTLSYYAK